MSDETWVTYKVGTLQATWGRKLKRGDCKDCGGECDGDDCGMHATGCFFGGPPGEGYWLIAEGCPLDHGEEKPS